MSVYLPAAWYGRLMVMGHIGTDRGSAMDRARLQGRSVTFAGLMTPVTGGGGFTVTRSLTLGIPVCFRSIEDAYRSDSLGLKQPEQQTSK